MSEKLSILIAQTNPTVGDIDHNKNIVLETIDKNHSIDLIIFSELMLTGYPPEDLVLKTAFRDKFMQALEEINAFLKNKNCTVILGMPWDEEGHLYNAAIVLYNGSIVYKHFKNALPNYGVFDEERVFTAERVSGPIVFKDIRIGLMICEDMWFSDVAESLQESGAPTLAISLHFSGLNPLDATISTLFQSSLSRANLKCQIAAALTPVPTNHFNSCSVLNVLMA
jgi:NAD+ synthase